MTYTFLANTETNQAYILYINKDRGLILGIEGQYIDWELVPRVLGGTSPLKIFSVTI